MSKMNCLKHYRSSIFRKGLVSLCKRTLSPKNGLKPLSCIDSACANPRLNVGNSDLLSSSLGLVLDRDAEMVSVRKTVQPGSSHFRPGSAKCQQCGKNHSTVVSREHREREARMSISKANQHSQNTSSQIGVVKSACSKDTDLRSINSSVSVHGCGTDRNLLLVAGDASSCCRLPVSRFYHSLAPAYCSKILQKSAGNTVTQTSCRKISGKRKPVVNLIKTLQPHIAVPILPEDQVLFDPSDEEISEAGQLFVPGHGQEIKFLKSVRMAEQLPVYDLPEVGFIGRSNVGKSSLIKALLSAAPEVEVKVSRTPGHTKMLNFFQVGKHFSIVDMPGYGFHMPKNFTDNVENFLHTRTKLIRTFVLLDASAGIVDADWIGLDMMEEFGVPYVMTFHLVDSRHGMTSADKEIFNSFTDMRLKSCIVLTKTDMVGQARLLKNLLTVLEFTNNAHSCFPQPFLVSSVNGDGVALLQTFIAYVTGNLAVEGA